MTATIESVSKILDSIKSYAAILCCSAIMILVGTFFGLDLAKIETDRLQGLYFITLFLIPFALCNIWNSNKSFIQRETNTLRKIFKIKKYCQQKKTILLACFISGHNRIFYDNCQDIAEMLADDVIIKVSYYHTIDIQLWNKLNKSSKNWKKHLDFGTLQPDALKLANKFKPTETSWMAN